MPSRTAKGVHRRLKVTRTRHRRQDWDEAQPSRLSLIWFLDVDEGEDEVQPHRHSEDDPQPYTVELVNVPPDEGAEGGRREQEEPSSPEIAIADHDSPFT